MHICISHLKCGRKIATDKKLGSIVFLQNISIINISCNLQLTNMATGYV